MTTRDGFWTAVPILCRRRGLKPNNWLLARLDSESFDTVAIVAGPGAFRGGTVTARTGGVGLVAQHPLHTDEQGILFPDGWIAVARLSPYRVEWRSSEGEWIRGQPIPDRPIRVNDAEKCHALRANYRRCENVPGFDWPDELPAFLAYSLVFMTAPGSSTLWAAPNGWLLIRRTPSATLRWNRYDIIDRRGSRVAVLTMEANEAIVGFGRRSVYTINTDDLGLQMLRRHEWNLSQWEES